MSEGAAYEIHPDLSRGLVTVVLRGFWTIETLDRFRAALKAAALPIAKKEGAYLCLADASDFAVQTQESLSRFSDLSADEGIKARKIAIVAPIGLSRMQLSRITPDDRRQIFANREEALNWLLADA
jgi:hypothetical protein